MTTLPAFIIHIAASFLPFVAARLPGVDALSAALDECADALGEVIASGAERFLLNGPKAWQTRHQFRADIGNGP